MWPILPLVIVAILQVGILGNAFLFQDTNNIEQVNDSSLAAAPGTWYPSAGYLKPANSTWGVQVPALSSCNTIDTDGTGKFICGTDEGGAAGSVSGTGSTNNLTFWTSSTTISATGSPSVGFIVATNTSATSSLPRLAVSSAIDLMGEYITNVTSYVRGLFTGGTGITISSGDVSFDCSEVEGSGINCSGENITLDATGDWTGTLDTKNASDFILVGTTSVGSITTLSNLSITESQISDLDHYTDSDIDGSESAFTGWDKNASDDWATTSSDYWETQQTSRTADDLSDNTTTDLGEGTNLYYTDIRVADYITSSTTLCVFLTGSADLCDGNDASGTGSSGLATSTDIADTLVIYGTSPSTVGAEAAFVYDDATNNLAFDFASSTAISSSHLYMGDSSKVQFGGSNYISGGNPFGGLFTNVTSFSFFEDGGFYFMSGADGSGPWSPYFAVDGYGKFEIVADDTPTGTDEIDIRAHDHLRIGNSTNMGVLDLHSLSAERTYTFPDKDGTFAMLDDIGGSWSTTSSDYWETQQTSRTADDLSDNTTTDLAEGTNLYYTNIRVSDYLVSSTTFCETITGSADLCDGSDASGTGGTGLATSTNIADTYVIYGTAPGTVGAESAFTYDDALDKLTVVNASTTALSVSGDAIFSGAILNPYGYIEMSDATPLISLLETDTSEYGSLYMSGGDLIILIGSNYLNPDNTRDIVLQNNLDILNSSIIGSLVPETNDAYDLGSNTNGWAGLWLGPDECIGFGGVEQICETVTLSNLLLDPGGASVSADVEIVGDIIPTTNDSGQLGTTSKRWSDLFLASGSVIDFNNDVQITHSNDSLSISGGTTTLASTTISGNLTFGGVVGDAWSDFCVSITGSADLCDGSDDGAAGAVYLASTTPWTVGELGWVVNNGTLASVATGTLTENITGLEFDATRSLVGGSAILGLTSGYNIPLTASTTNWNTAYNWGNHASAGYIGLGSLSATAPLRYNSGTGAFSWTGIATSTNPTTSGLATWTGLSTVGTVATGTLTENVTGLEFSATGNLVGSAAILGITTGYGIPLTASTTNWNSFYDTPSGRITAGDGLTWSANTLNFDGGNTPSGDLGGTWASPSVTDDSHAHTSTSISGIDISADTNLAVTYPVVRTDDTLSLAFSTTTDNTWSGIQTFTNATSAYLGVTTGIDLFGAGIKSTANALCIQLTGSSDLCDGVDDGGAGSSKWTAGTDFTYLTDTNDDLAIGSSATATAPFWWDVSATSSYIGNGGAGDSTIKLSIDSVAKWALGADDSDSDAFVISSGGTLGTNNLLRIDTTSAAFSATTTAPAFMYDADTGIKYGVGVDIIASNQGMRVANGISLTTIDPITANAPLHIQNWEYVRVDGQLRPLSGLDVTGYSTTSQSFIAQSTTATSSLPRLSVTTAFNFLGDYITNTATWFLSKLQAVSAFVAATSSTWDFGGATSLEIPNGASPTVDTAGEIALDTTDNQLLMADSGGTARVFAAAEQELFSVTVASTSVAFVSGGTLPLPINKDGFVLTQFHCYVTGGTSVVLNMDDGTNNTETITCATTATADTDVATNDTFTASELARLEFGTITGSVNYVSFTAYGYITRE